MKKKGKKQDNSLTHPDPLRLTFQLRGSVISLKLEIKGYNEKGGTRTRTHLGTSAPCVCRVCCGAIFVSLFQFFQDFDDEYITA